MVELSERLEQMLGGGYHIVDELSPGGMSRVFVAEETDLGRHIVVKVLPPELAADVNADRFRREIQTAARLHHPHLVPVLAAGSRDGLLYYTMPRIEGESLRARLKRCGQLSIAEAIRFLREVADALEYAHEHGVVHRDIKPDNVLISGHHAFVTDFGVSKALTLAAAEKRLTLTGMVVGTPAYMSPEQASGDPAIDERSDIYALGILGYEMIGGEPPFWGDSPRRILAAHIAKTPTPLFVRRLDVPKALDGLIMRCLAKDPKDRYQSAGDVREQLELAGTLATDSPSINRISEGTLATRASAKSRKPRDEELDVYGLTHRGLTRIENHDHFLIGQVRKRINVRQSSLTELSHIPLAEDRIASFMMVADGFGMGVKAEQASRMVLEVATRYLAESARCYVRVVEEQMDLGHALEEAAKACHEAIEGRASTAAQPTSMASTLTLFIGVWPWIYLLHSGTSRYYQFCDDGLVQLSRDSGLTRPTEHDISAAKPFTGLDSTPVVTRLPNSWNRVHLLCTDGLTKHVSEEQIAKRLKSIQSARQVCEDLIQDALDGGGTDNITVVVGRAILRE